MKKFIFLIILIPIFNLGKAQNLQSEYRYLCLVKSQSSQLIKDNLRNAEIYADSLFLKDIPQTELAALFFKELGDNYSAIGKADLALFSYLRQRFLYPNDSISLYVEQQMRINATKLNMDNQSTEYLIQRSSHYNLSSEKETNTNKLLYSSIQIETKNLSTLLLHYLDLAKFKNFTPSDFILKWEDVSRMHMPLKYKIDYVNRDFKSLNNKQQERYYCTLTRFYIQQKAWGMAQETYQKLKNLQPEKPKNKPCLKARIDLHL
ncbi:MAG: hypothetical protein JW729_09855 [Bacteroidales bacterium]|nr:hypothetical protein [Bacteroidales bacterium]